MAGRAAAREGLDDDHAATATRARLRDRRRRIWFGGLCIAGLGLWARCMEQLTSPRDVAGAGGSGEEAVVADTVEAVGQDVKEETADELGCGEGHDLVAGATVGAIVLVAEGDA